MLKTTEDAKKLADKMLAEAIALEERRKIPGPCPVVAIRTKDGRTVEINQSDFDSNIHTLEKRT